MAAKAPRAKVGATTMRGRLRKTVEPLKVDDRRKVAEDEGQGDSVDDDEATPVVKKKRVDSATSPLIFCVVVGWLDATAQSERFHTQSASDGRAVSVRVARGRRFEHDAHG